MDARNFTGWQTEQNNVWRPLRLLNLYRMILAGLFLVLSLSTGDIQPLAEHNHRLFQYSAFAYLLAGILFSFAIHHKWLRFGIQVPLHFTADLLAITLLMHASGGVTSGLGMLLVVSVAGISMLSPRRIALLFGSLAAIAVLGEEAFSGIYNHFVATHYTNTGILGATLLFTAVISNMLAQRLTESEALARQRSLDLVNLEQLNEYIIQHMQTGIMVVDEQARIRLMNESAWKLLDTPQKVNHRPLFEVSLVLADQLQVWREGLETEPTTFRTSKTSPDILPKFARLGKSKKNGTLVFLEDISAMAQRAQQMKLASLGRLTASIAHEIRNPLGAISHASQLLGESPTLDPADKRLTQIIGEHTQRVNRIIENVMSLSKRDRAAPVLFDLHPWLHDFIAEFVRSEQLAEADISLVPDDSTREVRMDPSQLHQVTWNLLQNGLRHSPKKAGQPRLILQTGFSADANRPYLDIIDHGPGISPEQSLHIFEPFYTTEGSGTGLGLYIARELCEGNRARLDYIPVVKGGSCFRITFADPRRKQRDIE
ncbi:two-component system sensor histidine kinase NtrB [Sulfuriflexus sp.]|uniref:two-component system sensor histidine kinase NtrB n=1 Tax=Sulfuriflexus sp. TaxID=2015443 RepID=UPI0028CC94A6|nr:ATP-binding protein [Sulfuriflexus sp.]MDT8404581.1 ATP-binding protein [Sulfuriflexus sp.]